jgi:hypothetical protein
MEIWIYRRTDVRMKVILPLAKNGNINVKCSTMSNGIQFQCNAIQIQYDTIQCVQSASVRTEWSHQSFFFLFFIFRNSQKNDKILLKARFRTQDLSQDVKSECTIGRTFTEWIILFIKWNINVKMSVCTNVTDGQTSFSYFSLVSVQSYSQKSVRPYGGPGKKKNITDKTWQALHTDRSEVIHSMAKICSWIYSMTDSFGQNF